MANKVTFDYSKAVGFVQEHEMAYMSELVAQAKEKLVAKSGAGNDFLGWIDLPVDYDKEEFVRIQKAAEKIRKDSEVLLVIGIGGSYLGARAAIEFLGHSFANVVSKEIRKSPEIYYVGNSISSTYIKHLIDVVGDRDFSINMISKSGTTTEPAIAFRVFKEILEKKCIFLQMHSHFLLCHVPYRHVRILHEQASSVCVYSLTYSRPHSPAYAKSHNSFPLQVSQQFLLPASDKI